MERNFLRWLESNNFCLICVFDYILERSFCIIYKILFELFIINYPYQKQQNPMATRIQLYVFTFMSYTSVHALRTAYSSSKAEISKQIDIENKLMGVLDSLMLLALGLGHFMHAIYPLKRPVRCLWIAMLASAANFALMPFLLLFGQFQNMAYLCIFQLLNGFLQSYTWPTLLMIINSKYSSDKTPILLGFWSTNANFGNIIGYLVFQFIQMDWRNDLYIAASFALINGLLIAMRIKELNLQKKEQKVTSIITSRNQEEVFSQYLDQAQSIKENLVKNEQNQNNVSEDKTSTQSTQSTVEEQVQIESSTKLRLLKDPKIILITACFSLIKSVIYGIMLWLPLYFKQRDGFAVYAQSIPITYDVAAIFGSVFIGYLFIKIINKGLLMIPFLVVLVLCFSFLRFFDFGVAFVFGIIAATGFCLGGVFNTLAGLVVIELSSLLPENLKSSSLGFYSAITMAGGNITTAATQLLIGFVIGKEHQQGIFLIFMIYSAISLLCLIGISMIHTLRKASAGTLKTVGKESKQVNISPQACMVITEASPANHQHANGHKNILLFKKRSDRIRLSQQQQNRQRCSFAQENITKYDTFWGKKAYIDSRSI